MNLEPTPTISLAGHPRMCREINARAINAAVCEWNGGRRRIETWTLCFWDGTFRSATDIKALVLV